jgi:hypothetical protein
MSGFFKEGLLLQVFQPKFCLLKVPPIHSAFHYPPQAILFGYAIIVSEQYKLLDINNVTVYQLHWCILQIGL